MHVLMLSWRGPCHRAAGGAEIYTQRILSGLLARGHRATWFCEGPGDGESDGIRIIPGGPAPMVYPSGALFLRRHASDFDVVVDQINVVGFLTPLYSPLPTLTLIHQIAAEVWAYEAPRALRHVGYTAERAMLSPYREVPFVTVSRTTVNDTRRMGWRGDAFIAPNGVDLFPMPPMAKNPDPTLIFLARWGASAKRLPHALDAFERIRAEIPKARLDVIGRGAPPLGNAPTGVTYHSNLTDADRDGLLARSWLLMATSVREGFGRMVLEAAVQGTPSIVYGTPGLAEAGTALNGAITVADPAAMAEAAIELLRNPARLRDMGTRAQVAAQTFTWPRAVDVWEDALHYARTRRVGATVAVAADEGRGWDAERSADSMRRGNPDALRDTLPGRPQAPSPRQRGWADPTAPAP